MIEYRQPETIKNIEPTAVALGNFDGVHRGHQELIRRTVETAKALGFASAVFTFSNHPKNVLSGKPLVKNILHPDEKAAILMEMGVDYLFSFDFTKDIMMMPPMVFLEELLIRRFCMKEAVCGFNYRFGYSAQGTPEFLAEQSQRFGYRVQVVPPFCVDGEVVSSTLVRDLIACGRVDECARFLGRFYSVRGRVVVGNRIGRKIGFPTLNCTVDETMATPSNGVYVTNCIYDGKKYASVTNVGRKPTIGQYQKNIETHLFGFDEEIYGEEIHVEFIKKLRDEYKFSSVEELSAQIARDCETARRFHETAAADEIRIFQEIPLQK